MNDFKIVIFMMAVLIGLTALVNKKKLPYPILLVLAGLVIGFVPHLPDLALDPDIIFVIILPPLLFDAASKTSWHEFRTSIRPISALAITLVFFTTIAVAVAAHLLIPGFTWPLSFILGAVVSPPDAVAASGIIKGLGLNKRVVTIIEGESLVNDASALISYRYAVLAVTTGSFVFWKAGLEFLLIAGIGISLGVACGFLFSLALKKIKHNPVIETSLTLLAPFVAYLGAEELHSSGVLAVVSTGLFLSWKSHEIFTYQARMRTKVVWDTLVFLLQGFIFILMGLQLPSIIKDLGHQPFPGIIGFGLIISLITILVRIAWVFAGAYFMNYFSRNAKEHNNSSPNLNTESTWKNVLIVAWTGTRGVISLAAALALPILLHNGSAFPKRHAIIFLAFVVIFVTLVIQGLSLPLLIKWLKIGSLHESEAEERALELYIASCTLHFIEHDLPIHVDKNVEEQLKHKYEQAVTILTKEIRRQKNARRKNQTVTANMPDDLLRARVEIGKFQRTLLLKIHKEEEYSDAAILKAERLMDIHELKLDQELPKENL